MGHGSGLGYAVCVNLGILVSVGWKCSLRYPKVHVAVYKSKDFWWGQNNQSV